MEPYIWLNLSPMQALRIQTLCLDKIRVLHHELTMGFNTHQGTADLATDLKAMAEIVHAINVANLDADNKRNIKVDIKK